MTICHLIRFFFYFILFPSRTILYWILTVCRRRSAIIAVITARVTAAAATAGRSSHPVLSRPFKRQIVKNKIKHKWNRVNTYINPLSVRPPDIVHIMTWVLYSCVQVYVTFWPLEFFNILLRLRRRGRQSVRNVQTRTRYNVTCARDITRRTRARVCASVLYYTLLYTPGTA